MSFLYVECDEGVTTVLTMVFLGIDNRRDLPRVSYSTALDFYVGTCFAFVLTTIIQFAGVHFHTKHGSGEHQSDASRNDHDCNDDDDCASDNYGIHETTKNAEEEKVEADGEDEEEQREEEDGDGDVNSTLGQKDVTLQVLALQYIAYCCYHTMYLMV